MLKDKREKILKYIQDHQSFLNKNAETLDIYEGNLKKYVDNILKSSLSDNYYNAIKDRVLPINILQRFIDKVSTSYSQPPKRSSANTSGQNFVDEYSKLLNIDQSGMIADTYSNLFKGYAWKPYIDKNGKPSIRELSFDRFIVISESMESPEEETIFVEFMGKYNGKQLYFSFTDDEFDAFYDDKSTAEEFLADNQGINLVGTIPYVYGKRQKNRLIPVQDSDILAITKAIPVMLSDAAGAQMFQCFTILYGIDVSIENAKMAPNQLWSIKSDKDSDKTPSIGSVKPEADTDKVIDFIVNIFVLWLETKGIRVGSMGSISSINAASGIAKIIDEMDVYEVKKRSMAWFKKDEEELWNVKLPKIHNYWIKSGMVDPKMVPGIIPIDPEIEVTFNFPEPMISKQDLLTQIDTELRIGTMSKEFAIRKLHPEYNEEEIQGLINGMDENEADDTKDDNTSEEGRDS